LQPRLANTTLKLILPGILLTVLSLAPFLNKAYTIDDVWFLLESRQILKTPIEPMSFPICWLGNETCVQRAASFGGGQGLMGYLLVPVMLAGGVEWVAHLLQLLLACVAIFAMVKLALRLGLERVQASTAGMLMAAIPPFLSMASTAMPDMAALAFGLVGIERLLAWKDKRHWHQAAAASLALGLAPYARPHVALLIPLGALWLFDEFQVRKAIFQFRRQAFLWTPLFAAMFILVAVNLLTRDRNSVAAPANILLGSGNFWPNLFAYLTYLFFPIPFTIVWLATHWRRAKFLIVMPGIPVLIAHFMLFPSRSLIQEWPVAAVLYSLTAIVDMIYRYLRSRNRIDIMLCLWMLMPLPAAIYIHFPIKYMVPVLPAIVLILIRAQSSLSKQRAALAFGALIFACTGFSLVLLRADADFAEYGRKAAAELIAPRVAAGEKVWYGGQWGFYWYAQEAGARISKPGDPGPLPGDLLAVGLMEGGGATLDRFPNRELVDSRSYDSPHGRTMGFGAGLYSNSFGYVPWRWNPHATNVYQLWRIR
jgi:4-amino-4-deoxy-L-arabinose transferase-like glycosyltransferase